MSEGQEKINGEKGRKERSVSITTWVTIHL
jgi:hypothetical protein